MIVGVFGQHHHHSPSFSPVPSISAFPNHEIFLSSSPLLFDVLGMGGLKVMEIERTGGGDTHATEPSRNAAQTQAQSQSQSNNPPAKRKHMKPRSKVWEHFTKFLNEAGEQRGKCNHCGVDLACDSRMNGTTALKNHLSTCKLKPPPEELVQSHLNFNVEDDKISLANWKFDQDAIRKALSYMIITDELPFKFIEGIGFRQFIATALPGFKIPSRWTVARDCFGIYIDEKLKFKDYLLSKRQMVCLTTDTWTSIQRVNYMCITAHFIDESWTLRKRILNFIPISSHKGRDIGMEMEKCLLEWGIDRVLTITVDNASSNDVMVGYLQEKITNWGHSILKCKFLHMRCVAHIINLIVTDGLKEIGGSVKKVREAVRYIRQSPIRMRKFKESCEDEKIQHKQRLCLDVSTRWNSTYFMLETAQKFEQAFVRYKDKDPYFEFDLEEEVLPEHEDWKKVRRMIMMLGHFYDLTLKISGCLFVTSNTFFREIYKLYRFLDEWRRSDSYELASMANNMKEKYDKYWGDPLKMNQLLYIATVLDPRYKLDWVQFALCNMYTDAIGESLGVHIKEVLNSLYNEYKPIVSSSTPSEREPLPQPEEQVNEDDDPAVKIRKLLDIEDRKFQNARLGGRTSRTEVDRYLNEEIEVNKDDFDILGWWKLNSPRFPVLSLLARDVLAIPISTVASESTFSTGGRVLDSFRSSLTPKVVQSLICAQDWLRRSLEYVVEEGDDDILKIKLDFQKIALEATVDI